MSSPLQPPLARPIPRSVTMHGDTRDDPYYWLRDHANPAVIAYLNAENAYLEQSLQEDFLIVTNDQAQNFKLVAARIATPGREYWREIIAHRADSARLAIMGGSAGGLLVGATVTMRPELFKAVIAHVPFVDVLNTMSDASIPLVAPEYQQWGNPANPAEYAYMKSYSPYDNIAAAAYPHMPVTASSNSASKQI